MFGMFKRRGLLSRIAIRIPDSFEENQRLAVIPSARLDDVYVPVVWAFYYAKMLFNLGECVAAEGMKAQLEAWAEPCAIPAATGLPLLEDMRVIDSEITLAPIEAGEVTEDYALDVLAEKDGPPVITTKIPRRGHQNRMAVTVIALAQHFIDEYDDSTGGQIALYTLAMRKHYATLAPYKSIKALVAVPNAAIRDVLHVLTGKPVA